MSSSPERFSDRPLLVVALGGNALSPPAGEFSYAVERQIVARTTRELRELVDAGYRLLIVHGNGPQVGRLMRDDVAGVNLDVYVSQTQGELGYLIVQGLRRANVRPCTGIITRTVVAVDDPSLAQPEKAIGPVLPEPPKGPSRAVGSGWRALVGSPEPLEVVELAAIHTLLTEHHVVAAGGGGIPVTAAGEPVQGVVDKDRVAALLAIALAADRLIFVTDVDGVYEFYGTERRRRLAILTRAQAEAMAGRGAFGAGSMAPKVESAVRYVRACQRPAMITSIGSIMAAMHGTAGTLIPAG